MMTRRGCCDGYGVTAVVDVGVGQEYVAAVEVVAAAVVVTGSVGDEDWKRATKPKAR